MSGKTANKQKGGNYTAQFQQLNPCAQMKQMGGAGCNIPTPYDLGVMICPQCGGKKRPTKKTSKK